MLLINNRTKGKSLGRGEKFLLDGGMSYEELVRNHI